MYTQQGVVSNGVKGWLESKKIAHFEKKNVADTIQAHMSHFNTGSQKLAAVFKARKCHLDFLLLLSFYWKKIVAIFISFHFDDAFFLTKGTLSERYSDTFRSRCGGIMLQTELCIGSIAFMCFCTEIRGNKLLALQRFDNTWGRCACTVLKRHWYAVLEKK